jgi:hypothetical protein
VAGLLVGRLLQTCIIKIGKAFDPKEQAIVVLFHFTFKAASLKSLKMDEKFF